MNLFDGMTPGEIASVVIIGLVCAFFLAIVVVTYVRNGVWIVFGVLLLVVVVLGVLARARG